MTKPTGRPRGRPKTKEYETLMARVPRELADRARRYAGLHQQSISTVLRDGLELLLEEDRYRPFLSDRNQSVDILSDRNGEVPRRADPQPDIVSDRKAGNHTPAVPLHKIMSDRKAAAIKHPRQALTTSADDAPRFAPTVPAPLADPQGPGILSDTIPAFNTSKYTLGKLCPRRHEHGTTGQSLLRWTNRHCLACDREKFHERKQAKRLAQTTG